MISRRVRVEVVVAASLLCGLVLVAVVSLLSVVSATRSRSNLDELEHAQLLALAADRLGASFQEAQRTQFAFLLGGDSTDLGAHHAARGRALRELGTLDSLLPEDDANRAATARIDTLLRELAVVADDGIRVRALAGAPAAAAAVRDWDVQGRVDAVERELGLVRGSVRSRHRADLVRAGARARRAQLTAAAAAGLLVLLVPLAARVIARDLRDRRELRLERDAAEKAATAATRARTAFAEEVGREIRAPVEAVLRHVEEARAAGPAEHQERLQTLHRLVDGLRQLVDDLLELSRVASDRVELDRAAFDLRDTIADALQPLAARAAGKGVALAYRVAPDVPSLAVGDAGRFRQIVGNVATHLLEFVDHGELVVDVDGTCTSGVLELRLLVWGPDGRVAADPLHANVEPATRPDDALPTGGLGLVITERLVNLMGGHIRKVGTPAAGRGFHLTLRLDPANDRVSPEPRPAVAEEDLPVLVADGQAATRRMLEGLLLGWRMQPTVVATGVAALRAADERCRIGSPFAVALLGSRLSDLDGFTVAAELVDRHLLRSRGILVITPNSGGGDRERAERLRLGAVLSSPPRPSAILGEIVSAVSAGGRGEVLATAPAPAVRDGVGTAEPVEPSARSTDGLWMAEMLELAGGDEALLSIIARNYLEQAPPLIAALRTAVDSEDPVATRQAAQRLRGASAQLAVTPAVVAAAMLEAMAAEGSLEDAGILVTEIEIAVDDLRRELQGRVPGTQVRGTGTEGLPATIPGGMPAGLGRPYPVPGT